MRNKVLSLKVKSVYRQQLEHELKQISYKLLDRIDIAITLEKVVTSPEKLLKDSDRIDLAKKVRQAVDDAIYP